MFKIDKLSLRLFITSLAMTMILMATVGGFILVYNSMRDMGITPDLPTVVSVGESSLIVEGSDRYYMISTNVLNELELLRRQADPLTLPRPVRLCIKLYALAGNVFEQL